MYSQYRYTDLMGTQFQKQISQLQSYYCREDFVDKLECYRKAKKDAKHFRRENLAVLCEAWGLDCDQVIADPSLLGSVPTREELTNKLLEIFHDLYTHSPNPKAYMARIVRMLAPEFSGDTVRAAILKKFIQGGGFYFLTYDTEAILHWAAQKLSPEKKGEYDAADTAKRLEMLVAELDDSIFTPDKMSVELTDGEMLALMARRMEKLDAEIQMLRKAGVFHDGNPKQLRRFCEAQGIPVDQEVFSEEFAELIMDRTRKFCHKHHIPCAEEDDFVGMLNSMISNLSEPDSEEDCDNPMQYVEACFKLLMRRTVYKKRNNALDTADSLFKTDVRDAKRAKQGTKWELLRLCDSLAAGNFKTNSGGTRIMLYQFAIMFSMTIALKPGDERDPDRDAVKHLFEDYYCDNMARFLDSAFADPNFASTQEQEPGGEGVNLKNFAEAIYVYYLYRKDLKLTPGERIDHAEKAIKLCVAQAKKTPDVAHPDRKRDYTSVFERNMVEQIIDADEKDLIELIVGHYYISAHTNAQILQASETNTAYGILREAINDMEYGVYSSGDMVEDHGDNEEAQEFASQLVDDLHFETDVEVRWDLAPLLLERYSQEEDFVRVVSNTAKRLSAEVDFIGGRKIHICSNLLHILCMYASPMKPISLEDIKQHIRRSDAAMTGKQINRYMELLHKYGFPVVRDDIGYFLEEKELKDGLLTEILDRAKVKYRYEELDERDARQELFEKLLARDGYVDRKITRTNLIAALTMRYLNESQDYYDLTSLPDIYDDFTTSVNPDLVESRFQPLNEKNILDMFVILSVYLYLIEYGKGEGF